MRPPLKWAGGKRWQVPHLLPLWTSHDRCRLVEPSCGGLAVARGLLPNRALLNDANPHHINFYRRLQRGLTTDLKMENNERLLPADPLQRVHRQRPGGHARRGRPLLLPESYALQAFLVFDGDGWTLRDYFTAGQLAEHLNHAALVRVVTLEAFIRLANNTPL